MASSTTILRIPMSVSARWRVGALGCGPHPIISYLFSAPYAYSALPRTTPTTSKQENHSHVLLVQINRDDAVLRFNFH